MPWLSMAFVVHSTHGVFSAVTRVPVLLRPLYYVEALPCQVAAGGLVSALMGVGNFQARWIGWPGVYVEDGFDREALTDALAAENYIPVYLDANTVLCAAHLLNIGFGYRRHVQPANMVVQGGRQLLDKRMAKWRSAPGAV